MRRVPGLPMLCAALLTAVLGACGPGLDDAPPTEVPTEPVTQIDSSDGPLLLGAPPAEVPLGDDVLAAAARGVVAVRATGCGPVANGTAFAVAPGLLVGAAHVVSGATTVETEWLIPGSTEPSTQLADIVGYEEASDLTLLRIDAEVPPLVIGQAQLGATGAVLGFSASSEFLVSPARIEHYVSASGLWGSGTARSVYVLAADVRKGQSGGPLVDRNGSVVGVAFATARGPAEVGFAFSLPELVRFLMSSGVDARTDDQDRVVIAAQPERLSEVPNGTCRVG